MLHVLNFLAPACTAITAVSLHMIALAMGREVYAPVRWLVTGLTAIFGGAFILMTLGGVQPAHTGLVAFFSVAALVVGILAGIYRQHGIDGKVIKAGMFGLVLVLTVWGVGSCISRTQKPETPEKPAIVNPSDREAELEKELEL